MSNELIINTQDLKGFWQAFKAHEAFDVESFQQLVQDTGEDTTLKILARFTETLKEVEGHVLQGREAEDSDMIWRACHKVAGSATLIGFTKYGNFSRELSHQIRANPDLSNYVNEIESFLNQTRSIRQEINSQVANISDHL